ncbi:MAG: hypothetical protein SYR96_03530 [Actinomycetota bacterium]|nr:hypothetical protein [Actinomycetota bacterium]
MTEQPHRDQLREAFELHEDNTPDPAAVYARVQQLSQKYKRRRRGAQVAAGGVLGAGLIAGAINLPAFLPANNAVTNTAAGVPAGAPAATPSAPAGTAVDANLQAYAEAGYGYEDAGVLARLWKMNADDRVAVKSEAGRRLLLGETLPFKPLPDTPAQEETISPEQDRQFQAFFNAGYTWDEAEKLAKIWKLADPADAKLEGGKRLLAGEELPVKPKKENVAAALENKRADAFWAAGYGAEDAEKLAKIWKLKDTWSAKVEAGKRLLAGQTLPIKP